MIRARQGVAYDGHSQQVPRRTWRAWCKSDGALESAHRPLHRGRGDRYCHPDAQGRSRRLCAGDEATDRGQRPRSGVRGLADGRLAVRQAGAAHSLIHLAAAAVACVWPAASPANTYANPMDLDYRYGFQVDDPDKAHRSGADPVFVRHKGAYYLFLTMADGYWRSTDLAA